AEPGCLGRDADRPVPGLGQRPKRHLRQFHAEADAGAARSGQQRQHRRGGRCRLGRLRFCVHREAGRWTAFHNQGLGEPWVSENGQRLAHRPSSLFSSTATLIMWNWRIVRIKAVRPGWVLIPVGAKGCDRKGFTLRCMLRQMPLPTRQPRRRSALLGILALATALAYEPTKAQETGSADACERLAHVALPATKITEARGVASGTFSGPPAPFTGRDMSPR